MRGTSRRRRSRPRALLYGALLRTGARRAATSSLVAAWNSNFTACPFDRSSIAWKYHAIDATSSDCVCSMASRVDFHTGGLDSDAGAEHAPGRHVERVPVSVHGS